MLGKRPPQIQRSTSMSQLRAPPGSRTRAPAPGLGTHTRKECVSQKDNSPSAYVKGGGVCNLQPPTALDNAQQAETKIESPHNNANMVNVGVLPVVYPHVHGQLKPPHLLKVGSSAPLPVLAKPASMESFLDACFSCKRPLGHGRDIFMYRGDAAFCTEECRLRQISHDETYSMLATQSTASDTNADNPKGARISAPTGAF